MKPEADIEKQKREIEEYQEGYKDGFKQGDLKGRTQTLEKVKEKLQNKDFIIKILNEDVSVDTEEEMKFIDVEGVRKKFENILSHLEDDEVKE